MFNKTFSKYRVRVEHCIGEIKKRFPSLDKLPVKIKSENDIALCSRWVSVAAMLHNFAKDHDDSIMYDCNELVDTEAVQPVHGEDEEEDAPADGEQKRQWLFQQLFDSE